MATNPFIRSNNARLAGPADRTGIVVDAHAKAAARAVGPPGVGRARLFAGTRIVRADAMTRTRRLTLTFKRPFTLMAVERQLPPGDYELVTDEELIEELSFPVYRRVASWIIAPAQSGTATEMISIAPAEIAVAHERDQAFEP